MDICSNIQQTELLFIHDVMITTLKFRQYVASVDEESGQQRQQSIHYNVIIVICMLIIR